MIRSALLLIRTSMPSVLVLGVAVTTLVNVMASEPGDDGDTALSSMPSLAPLPKSIAPAGSAAAALRVPLFDPERRPESVAGSIDDLRVGAAPPPPPAADVTLSGVLVGAGRRRAMLAVAGGRSAWSDVGGEVGGWRVAAVDAAGALLERDGQTLSLTIVDRLKNRAKGHAADAAPVAAPPDGAPGGDGGPPQPPPDPDPLTPPDAVTPRP